MNRRITVLFPIAGLPLGGTEQQLLELVKGLDKRRFRPIVLNLHYGEPLEREFKAVPGIRVISLEGSGKHNLLTLVKICSILRRMKVDIVQPFLTPATFFAILAALLCRTPVKIVTERSGLGRKRGTPLRYRLYLRAEDFLTHFADWVVPNSNAGEHYLIERGIDRRRVKVIYNGIDYHRVNSTEEKIREIKHELNVAPGGKVVGIIATLFPVKNHAIFLQAAALIDQSLPGTRFALVGDGPLRSQLESLSSELGLASKATFFGSQRDVGAYLSALDIAVLTSDTEGCSNFLLEAMALGKAVVATDAGGNRELVQHGETGVLVPPRDSKAVAKAVIDLIQHPEKAASMGQKARERVMKQFALDNMVHQYESLYENSITDKINQVSLSAAELDKREV
jgi:glycosyltransferase involved in cell wall biosynthesis